MTSTKRPTLVDVAKAAKVSVSTASLAFSGAERITPKTKAKVEAAAAKLGYHGPNPMARSLRSGRSHIVGVVTSEQLGLSFRDPFSLSVMDALVSALGDQGLGVLLVPAVMSDTESDEPPLLATASMDIAVVMRVRDHDDPTLEVLARRGIPAVVMEGPLTDGAGRVTIDDTAATVELITHLTDLGHTRIATVTLPFDERRRTEVVSTERMGDMCWTPTRNRLAAFEAAGVEPTIIVEARGSVVEEGMAAGHIALAMEPRPTAIVCQSDILAAGVILAARELDLRVPQDLSVTGFDGLDLPWLAPDAITTMSQHGAKKGQALAEEVRALLAGELPEPIQMPLTFTKGTTTGKARN